MGAKTAAARLFGKASQAMGVETVGRLVGRGKQQVGETDFVTGELPLKCASLSSVFHFAQIRLYSICRAVFGVELCKGFIHAGSRRPPTTFVLRAHTAVSTANRRYSEQP